MKIKKRLLVLAAAALTANLCGPRTALAADAKPIFDLAGVQEGLCVHLGAGNAASPNLTAEMAAGSKMLVHGLAADDASVARARKAIETKGLTGRAMVEKAPEGPLPYLNDLADLVVMDSPETLAALKVSKEEALRVLAPGGVLVTTEGGKLVKSVKPRPKEMDEWTHPHHGADGNMVSTDRAVKFPIGLRWLDGLPMNINRWAACRSWIVAGGRVFTVSSNQMENIDAQQKPYYLCANDAWNGLPLWKINLGTTDDGAFLTSLNMMPVAAEGSWVFAGTKDNVIGVDAAKGQTALTLPTKYMPAQLVFLDGVVVATCWEAKTPSQAKFDRLSLWATWAPRNDVGSVEAYDAKTGKQLWAKPAPSVSLNAADGVVYLLAQKNNSATERTIVAVDLKTGVERWRVPHTQFGADPDLQILVAAKGYVVVGKIGDITGLGAPKKEAGEKPKEKGIFVLSATDGHVLWKVDPSKSIWTPIVDGLLWCQSDKFDPLTGQAKAKIGWGLSDQFCTPQAIVGSYLTRTRGGQYIELPGGKEWRFGGARGACMEGMVAANGMFYTAQNNCACSPGQVYGFVAAGPCGELPAPADFLKARPTEKGPAFGEAEDITKEGDWPTYRHDPERTAATKCALSGKLRQLWKTPVTKPGEGPVAEAWKSRLASSLTAPVSTGKFVFTAATDRGTLFALDASSGALAWSAELGGRIDTPPTICKGLCLIGSHDGWVYAFRAKDGQLAWRTRVAPYERRMAAFGAVESVWPAVGTVLVYDGLAYANAGRSSESDGGIAVVALDPATGEFKWGKNIRGADRMNDLLAVRDNSVGWWTLRFDAKSGDKPAAKEAKGVNLGGMLDPSWTIAAIRRTGNAFTVGDTVANLLAWNDKFIASPKTMFFRDKESPAWQTPFRPNQNVEAQVLAGGLALFAGHAAGGGGKPAGFLDVLNEADGKAIAEFPLEARPVYDGLAVANGRVFLSLQDGSIVCFGE